ncbi:hypothetical protein D3C72_1698230 [compost metagenome]
MARRRRLAQALCDCRVAQPAHAFAGGSGQDRLERYADARGRQLARRWRPGARVCAELCLPAHLAVCRAWPAPGHPVPSRHAVWRQRRQAWRWHGRENRGQPAGAGAGQTERLPCAVPSRQRRARGPQHRRQGRFPVLRLPAFLWRVRGAAFRFSTGRLAIEGAAQCR